MPTVNETQVRLRDVATEGSGFDYTYDFGDGWEHRIEVESVGPSDPSVEVPSCIGGRRGRPPEDCGGPWGYEHLLEILADPNHPEYDERVEWIGRPFDPARFDSDDFAVNLQLQDATDFDR